MSLLNLINVPNNEISGLSEEMLTWVTSESGDRYITELTKSFEDELNQIEVYEDLNEETLTILREAETYVSKAEFPQSTQKQTKKSCETI